MEWIEPKTNWKVEYDEKGNYIGDYLNIVDINRMINNTEYIVKQCNALFGTSLGYPFEHPIIGEELDRYTFNGINYLCEMINEHVKNKKVTELQEAENTHGVMYFEYVPSWTFWNAFEQITKLLHDDLMKIQNNKRKLKYQFGIPNTGGF